MSQLFTDFYNLAMEAPCINTHCHIDVHRPQIQTLPDLLSRCYINWQYKGMIHPGMEPTEFLDKVSCNSYFYTLAATLGQLYSHNQIPLCRENWEEIEQNLAIANAKSNHIDSILREKCNYKAIVGDMQLNPGDDNGEPSLYRPAFRCDMFIKGHPHAGRDENGNDPRRFIPAQGKLSMDAYLDEMDKAIGRMHARGAVAIKLAIAYERGLDFTKANLEDARRGWEDCNATPMQIKAFEDLTAYRICRRAGQLGMAVQIHTGTGCLVRTNALWLKPLLDACPDTQFVLLHCSYPHIADCMSLVHSYNNVYVDLSWLPLLSPGRAAAVFGEIMDLSDSGRLGWGCDAETAEESLASKQIFCRVLAETLDSKVEHGYYSPALCRKLISDTMFNGPKALYKV